MDQQLGLLPSTSIAEASDVPSIHSGKPRLNVAIRNQIEFRTASLDDLLPSDHNARFVWAFVEELDLSAILRDIRSVEYGGGRPATDPRILLALWLYATLEGIVSARTIAEYCHEHIAYQWLCGGVGMNHHTISDFAVDHGEQFEEFLAQSVAILMKQGFVTLEEVSQDGVRVRASAGSSSFRREPTLEDCYEKAKQFLASLREELKSDPTKSLSQKQAATQRSAKEREDRVKEALEELKKLKEEKRESFKKQRKTPKEEDFKKVRVSTTDPQARVMKMACGGFRPAYNIQFATDTGSRVIVGVDVNNRGNDTGLINKMVSEVEKKHGVEPGRWLVDGGYVDYAELNRVSESHRGTKVYMPPRITPNSTKDPYSPMSGDSEAVAEWRKRMKTDEAKEIYKRRGSTAEHSNAQARNRGLQQFTVRGIRKVKAVASRFALVHNMQRWFILQTSCRMG